MSARLAIAVSVSGALHLAVAAALITMPTRPLGEPPEQGVGITVVFSSGGGGEQVGEAAPDAAPAETEPALAEAAVPAAAPEAPVPEPPPVESAALPLPPPPPRAPPRASPAPPGTASEAVAAPAAEPASAGAMPTAGLLDAAMPASVGRRVDPVVPREARLYRWQGTVLLAVTVSPEGVPSLVEIMRSSGHALLDRSAIEAMWQWRFDPARRGGVPVEERVAIPITFRIVD
ncbi:energy transducer TonB [Elioraea tepidiphila]|uniref:energy transducer TonB n=1 Tax=Elioraea tepidiphila TaxID=457934 RepID=UPI000365C657|nr:energy transducer TonB [Elioraea tepidiphila]